MLHSFFYLLLCICIAYFSLNVYHLTKSVDESNIIQIDYVNENTFDSQINKKTPICIYKANIQLPELFLEYTYPSHPNIIEYMQQLHSPLSFEHKVFNNTSVNNVLCTNYARTFIIQSKNETEIQLFAPSQKHLLYLQKNKIQYSQLL